jgi:catalase
MAKTPKPSIPAKKPPKSAPPSRLSETPGSGGELHQRARDVGQKLTTNFGVPLSDNQNSLRYGDVGPTLLEDFALREKIFHFDHERIPERIVHARGSGAHGFFECTAAIPQLTKAELFQKRGEQVPVFCRFSTVAGGAGSVDTPRDVRGFAVKFYTQQGNWDLVGNNIPVFFIQDAIKFPDLIHSVKMEANSGYPQAASAHDTFWDFVSLMPEATHMVMWAMSDRTLPRSLRMMDGFGVHTFRLVNAKGESTFVKFHWRPKLGVQSTVWDEAVKLAGADPDFHRRDLYEAIDAGNYPEWDLAVQVFDQALADTLPYDVLDATKLIPEEIVPLKVIGRMVLNRNPDNFFAETEQVAFLPTNIVPGIDFSNDPLLQGRLFSYLDTQKSRLGTTNFHQLPINAPKCPFGNFERDGMMQTQVPTGRANYEPNSLALAGEDGGPREANDGFSTYPDRENPHELNADGKVRHRSETFADHYSQARLFYRSQLDIEQAHIASALVFELSKVTLPHVREQVLANLQNVDADLAVRVAAGLGSKLPAASAPARAPIDLPLAPSLSIVRRARPMLEGRSVGILFADGSPRAEVLRVKADVESHGGSAVLIATKLQGTATKGGALNADAQLAGRPSVTLDAIALVLTKEAATEMSADGAAIQFVMDAHAHLKAIGYAAGAQPLLDRAGVPSGEGITGLGDAFVSAAGQRFYDREPSVRRLA